MDYNTELSKSQEKITKLRKKGEVMLFTYVLIEELCKKNGVNITTLCRECKIPRSSLTDYKMGRIKSLSIGTLCKIADYFDVSVEFLCTGKEKPFDEERLKTILFGNDITVTEEMWNEVKNYAQFVKERHIKKD